MKESQLQRDPEYPGLPPILSLDHVKHVGPCVSCMNEKAMVSVSCASCGLTVCAKCLSLDGFCNRCVKPKLYPKGKYMWCFQQEDGTMVSTISHHLLKARWELRMLLKCSPGELIATPLYTKLDWEMHKRNGW